MISIKLSELKIIAEKLISHLEARGEHILNIDEDYYWEVLPSDRYNVKERSSKLGLGQLTDDVEELERIIRGDKLGSGFDLVRLSMFLRILGERVSW